MEWDEDGAWTDPDFPPDMTSIGTSSSKFNCANSVDRWVRATHLGAPGEATMFDKICPEDIVQGDLDDCWLLASIACLAEFPDALKSLFANKVPQKDGCYYIYLFDILNDDWEYVMIDDFIPCKTRGGVPEPIFAKSVGVELWAVLLEKAFAKFCGSYGALAGGYAGWAFQALSGDSRVLRYSQMPNETGRWRRSTLYKPKQLEHPRVPRHPRWTWANKDVFDLDVLWAHLCSHMASSRMACCLISGTSAGADEAKGKGLITNHLYSFLRASTVELADGSQERLVKLRNPYGNRRSEFKGDWNDSSNKWRENPSVASELGFEPKADGAFWMAWSDWTSAFTAIHVGMKSMTGTVEAVELPQGNVIIENVNARGKYLNVGGNRKNNGANIHIWNNPNYPSTQWRLHPVCGKDSAYTIENVNAPRKFMNVCNNSRENGGNIHLWDNPNYPSSQWRLHPVSGKLSTYTIENVDAAGKYINVNNDSRKNGGNANTWDNPDATSSQWRIMAATSPEEMDSEDAQQVKSIFCQFDSDGNGTLEIGEIVALFEALGIDPAAAELVDADGDGLVNVNEFLNYIMSVDDDGEDEEDMG